MKHTLFLSLLALGLLALAPSAHAQLNFVFTFDPNSGNLGGTGTLDLASDPGNGTFLYSSLSPTYLFTVNGDTYTNADFVSDPNACTLVISDLGGGERGLTFSDTGNGGGAPFDGTNYSVQLFDGIHGLAFSPSYYPESFYIATGGDPPRPFL